MNQEERPCRIRIVIRGAVQGVGFRPFVYRTAHGMGLRGWVQNTGQGVCIEAEGKQEELAFFAQKVRTECPPLASIQSLETTYLDALGAAEFEIRRSAEGVPSALILPDIATCRDCLDELFDPGDRRYRYPFTNCTNCGPRFSIVRRLPYDRANTTMAGFVLCRRCREEFEDPSDRRFHAQPNACPRCGPRLRLRSGQGDELAREDDALEASVERLRQGAILAVKGVGGFHLMVDATVREAVVRLRRRKLRQEKPFAVMMVGLEEVRRHAEVSPVEEDLLASPEAPIVLLQRCAGSPPRPVVEEVAPGNPRLGILLPSTPLHHLLLRAFDGPLVATSGNLSGDPICRRNREALERLGQIADFILEHDRPIARSIDDSILVVQAGRPVMLRRARGFAPLPLPLGVSSPPLLAVGAHLKCSVALARDEDVFVGQHVGDLDNLLSLQAHRESIQALEEIYQLTPALVIHDLHPDYASTRYAEKLPGEKLAVQHHYAHLLSCLTENQLKPPVLGVIWDGTGYGTDGTLWGGEFLLAGEASFERCAAFRSFPLPGSETAIREPRRSALGLLFELEGRKLLERSSLPSLKSFTLPQLGVLLRMLESGFNSPRTSSVGRLFDAVASLLGIRQQTRFEGQAAMELEFGVDPNHESGRACVQFRESGSAFFELDWESFLNRLLASLSTVSQSKLAGWFHDWLVESMVAAARRIGMETVVLSGGCFQNRFLTERAISRLQSEGFRVYWHQRVPPNDGGIALGQIRAGVDYLRRS